MPRFASRLAILLLATALSACSMLSTPDLKDVTVNPKAPIPKNVAADLDGNLRQAQLLRLAGKHDEAIQILSQLMLVAADDGRVVGEYGKALAQKGRSQDATQFLHRAVELSPNEWSYYSALGVAYDQIGDQENARAAYERALSLKPGDATVLNNYALSRMLAKDPEGARQMIAMAQSTGKPGDEKIARNVELINKMAPPPALAALPKPAPAKLAKKTEAPQVVAKAVAKPAPPIPVVDNVASKPAPPPVAQATPRVITPAPAPAPVAVAANPELEQTALAVAEQTNGVPDRTVVMQAVPFDPLAGPVKAKARPAAVRKTAAKTAAKPVKQAQVPSLRVATEQY
jgi:Flp pilus assembly protein TadD